MEHFQAFSLVLLKEIEVLEQIPPLQTLIRDAVIKREWADYEVLMESIGETGARFEVLDAERETLFRALSGGDEPFYTWAARLPEEERNGLSGLYRKIKMITLQIKIANDALLEYLREARNAVAGVLDRAYPDRRGKMYSRRGIEREADMRSVMVNRTL